MMSFRDIWLYLLASPVLWVGVTLLAYRAAYCIYRRSGMNPIANPVLVSVTFIICVLLLTNTPYQTYFDGARCIFWSVRRP